MYENRHIVVFGIVPVFMLTFHVDETAFYMNAPVCSKKFPFPAKMWYTKSDYRIMV